MKQYTYAGGLQQQSSEKEKNMPKSISHAVVQKHMTLLIGQAILLVLLALIHLGFQAQATRAEAGADAFIVQNRVRMQAAKMAQRQTSKKVSDRAVLGAESSPETSSQKAANTSMPHAAPTPAIHLNRSYYSIALIGDSMEDTMGENADFLHDALATKYPDTQFIIYNYGKGARNVETGLKEFHEAFTYKDRKFLSIDQVKPDIIIVGSFGYNPFVPHSRDKHWLLYTQLLQEAQKITPNVYILAEIAPVRSGFGLGPNGVMWDPQTAWAHTGEIIEQLKNAIGLSATLQIPLIDAYTPSLAEGREEGRRELINTSDNIHPSEEGHKLMARIIADTIDFEWVKE